MEYNQATPNAHQMIALCMCNNMTPSQTQTRTEFEGDTELWKTGISPGTNIQQIHSLTQACRLKQITPLEFNQPTLNSYQTALCLCNNMTLSLTEAPLKKE